jgi:hypothetical protein
MNINSEIEKVKKNIEGYKRTLNEMPEDTFLGRVCIKAYLKREEKKLKKLIEHENSCSN